MLLAGFMEAPVIGLQIAMKNMNNIDVLSMT